MGETGGSPPAKAKDRLLSLGVHEFRTPITVISGYLRMLITGRTGELTDGQRKMLKEMEKSTARLSALVGEMSDLSALEAGGATFNLGSIALGTLIAEEIAALPPLPDREVRVVFDDQAPGATVHGDAVRLRTALHSLMIAHRRELVTSDELRISLRRTKLDGRGMLQITIGGADRVDELQHVGPADLTTFEEFRGGVGFTLPIARRIVHAHQGQLWSLAENSKAAAVLYLPEA